MDEFFDFIALAQDKNDLEVRRRVSFVPTIRLSDIIKRGIAYTPTGVVIKARITKTITGPE